MRNPTCSIKTRAAGTSPEMGSPRAHLRPEGTENKIRPRARWLGPARALQDGRVAIFPTCRLSTFEAPGKAKRRARSATQHNTSDRRCAAAPAEEEDYRTAEEKLVLRDWVAAAVEALGASSLHGKQEIKNEECDGGPGFGRTRGI